MKIIFLDVDGVINSIQKLKEVYYLTNKPHSGIDYPFDDICLNNLKELINETEAKIVVTSTWRKTQEGRKRLEEELDKYDLLKDLIGYTKVLENRAIEIKDYLNNLEGNIQYIILDDDYISKSFNKYLIKCDNYYGFREAEKERAIKELTKNKFARK